MTVLALIAIMAASNPGCLMPSRKKIYRIPGEEILKPMFTVQLVLDSVAPLVGHSLYLSRTQDMMSLCQLWLRSLDRFSLDFSSTSCLVWRLRPKRDQAQRPSLVSIVGSICTRQEVFSTALTISAWSLRLSALTSGRFQEGEELSQSASARCAGHA